MHAASSIEVNLELQGRRRFAWNGAWLELIARSKRSLITSSIRTAAIMMTDLRIAFRQLRKSPGFALTAIVTLALGIGANAVVFSVLNAVVLRPVNVPNAQNLYTVQRVPVSVAVVSRLCGYAGPEPDIREHDDVPDHGPGGSGYRREVRRLRGLIWRAETISTRWGFSPTWGASYHAADEQGPGSAPYAVLSYAYWHGHFHGDAGVVGTDGADQQAPASRSLAWRLPAFRGTELFFAPAMWIPMVEQPTIEGYDELKQRGNHNGFVVGRLKPGVTTAQATEDLNALGTWLAKTYPGDDDGLKFTLARPGLVGDMLGGPARAFMAGLMLLAGLILLAACANLGSLFAARAADRAKETALRLALGSRRGLILRQMLTEAVLVSLAGGALGLAGGVAILRFLSAWQPIPDTPINVPVNPDAGTYLVALVLALGSGLLFGMVPVRQVMRADPWQVIRTGAASVGGLRRFTLRDVLLAVQIAICAVLVTSSLVAVRGLARSMHSNFGFVPQNVMLGGDRAAHVGLHRRASAADAAAHAGCGGRHSGRDGCGLYRPPAAGPVWRRLGCLRRQHHGLSAHQYGRRRHELPHLAGLHGRPQAPACWRAET